MAIAVLVLILGVANCFNAVAINSTMARYTLMYSWLLIPFAFEGLRALSSRWPWLENRETIAGVVIFFLVWQAGIVVGANYGPPRIADRLASVSPTLPLSVELRNLVRWLDTNRAPQDALIFDDFNYEAIDVIRYAHIPSSKYFRVPYSVDPTLVEKQVREFIASQHPRFLVYSPRGLLRSIWPGDTAEEPNLEKLDLQLYRRWQQGDWEVYEIRYGRSGN
jgi:hypothetical protein